jgi:hypothetical protein
MSQTARYSSLQQAQHYVRRLQFECFHPVQFYRMQRARRRMTREGYCLRPFDEHHAIFVHIPKCAGVSISQSLFGYPTGGHATMNEYQIIFSPREIRDYFKFTVVRNPWDRLVSAFLFLKHGGMNVEDKTWAQEHLSRYEDFDTFVRVGISQAHIRARTHFRPQCDFICLRRGEPSVDFIGYYENLEADFSHICQRLNASPQLPKLNESQFQKERYQNYYTEETRRKVADVYADDIRVLGYSFDNANLSAQLLARDRV